MFNYFRIISIIYIFKKINIFCNIKINLFECYRQGKVMDIPNEVKLLDNGVKIFGQIKYTVFIRINI